MPLGAECLSEAEPGYRSGLQVSRRQGKNQLIGEVNSVQHYGNENKFLIICFHSYMSSQACCCVPVLPGSTSTLAVGLQQHASFNAMKVILPSSNKNPNTILFDKASH